jgi:5'-3' exonuclease
MTKSFTDINSYNDTTLMVVDALNLAFRYKHAKSHDFAEDYVRVIDSLKKSYKAGKVIVAGDMGSSSYRKAIYPQYKQNRSDKYAEQTPEEALEFEMFFEEFNKAIELVSEKYPVLRFNKVEADDIAAYICKTIKQYPIDEVWLISSDKDWDLLINEQINRFSYVTRKEITNDNWYEHYDCDPDQYISIKCLMGDSGDNVKGVEGIGPKRAAELIKTYGSAFDIVAALPITSKYKYVQSLNSAGDTILLNYQLMDLVTYCDDALGESTKEIDKLMKEYLK